MIIKVLNPTNRNIGFKGVSYQKHNLKKLVVNSHMLHILADHPELEVVYIDNFVPEDYKLDTLKLIADIKNINITGLNKQDIIDKLNGVYEEEQEEVEEEEEVGEE